MKRFLHSCNSEFRHFNGVNVATTSPRSCVPRDHDTQRHRGTEVSIVTGSNQMRRMCSIALAITFCQGCGAPGADAAGKALVVRPGTRVTELVAQAGPPTSERTVDKQGHPNDPCAADGRGVRALNYEIPGEGSWRRLLERLGTLSVSSVATVCVDGDQKVTATYLTQF
jgi:hypothetical protein